MLNTFKYFWNKYPTAILLLSVGHIIESALEIVGVSLFVPLLMLAGGADFLGQGPLAENITKFFAYTGTDMTIQTVLAFLLIVFFLKAIFQIGLRYYSCELTSKFVLDVSTDAVKKLEVVSDVYLKGRSRADISNVLTEQLKRTSLIILWLLMAIAAAVSSLAYIIFAVVVSYKIVFVLAPILVLVSILAQFFMRYSRKYGQEHSDFSQTHVRVVLEFLENIKTAKSFGRANKLGSRTLPSISLVARNWRQLQFLSSSLVAAFQPLMAIALAVGFYILSILKVPLAEIIVCLISFQKIYPSITNLQMLRTNILLYVPSLNEVQNLIKGLSENVQEAPEKSAFKAGFASRIDFEDVTFSFGEKNILQHVNFSISKGKVTAIVGRSGEGKSTIIEMVAQFLPPTTGAIVVDARNIEDMSGEDWRSHLAIVPQSGVFLNDTVEKNITYLAEDLDQDRLQNAIDMAQASEFISHVPGGLQYKLNDASNNLSGGQKQRLLIARALYAEREFLIFDEPTSALDSETERRILEMLEKLKENRKTILLITHNRNLLKVADVVYKISNGILTAEEPNV